MTTASPSASTEWTKGQRVRVRAFNPTRERKVLRRGTVLRTVRGLRGPLVEVLVDTHRKKAQPTEVIALRPGEILSLKHS